MGCLVCLKYLSDICENKGKVYFCGITSFMVFNRYNAQALSVRCIKE